MDDRRRAESSAIVGRPGRRGAGGGRRALGRRSGWRLNAEVPGPAAAPAAVAAAARRDTGELRAPAGHAVRCRPAASTGSSGWPGPIADLDGRDRPGPARTCGRRIALRTGEASMSTRRGARTADRLARVALTWLTEPGTRSVHRLVERLGRRRPTPGPAARRRRAGARSCARRWRPGSPPVTPAARRPRGDWRGPSGSAPGSSSPEDDEWPARRRRPGAGSRLSGRRAAGSTGRPPRRCASGYAAPGRWARRWTGRWPWSAPGPPRPYGVHVATELGYGLAERDWTVVSGGAFGIDAAAHRGALTAGGLTVAVLACGVDRPYPVGNAALFDRIAETGLLVSEWPPGAEPLRPRFLIRNRVIAAATRGTVLVEAAARSGATQTLRRALAHRPAGDGGARPGHLRDVGRRPRAAPGAARRPGWSPGCAHVLEEVGRIGADLAPPARGPRAPRGPARRRGGPGAGVAAPPRVASARTRSPPGPGWTSGRRCANCPCWRSWAWWSAGTAGTPSPHRRTGGPPARARQARHHRLTDSAAPQPGQSEPEDPEKLWILGKYP